jgi:hypothetical protein
MSCPEYIINIKGKYYCSLCRPDKQYGKYYLFNLHIYSDAHKRNVDNEKKKEREIRNNLKSCSVVENPKSSQTDDSKTCEEKIEIVKKCLEDNKKMKDTIENQEKVISMLRNKMDEMVQVTIQKIRIYNEESDKLDKMVADKKKELLNELFGIV